jgi:hypothetical protein
MTRTIPQADILADAVRTGASLNNRTRSRRLPSLPPRIADQVGENLLLNVDDLKIDHTYQRPADPYHIQAMANNFDLKRLFRIAVNQRPDGSYFVVDGQQRVSAIKLLGGDYLIDCVVYHLATVEEEAALYYYLNWDRKNPSSFDRWRARLALGDPDIIRIQAELDHFDLKLAKSGDSLRTIRAIGTLQSWADRDIESLSVAIMILGKLTYLAPIDSEVFSGLCYVENHLRAHSNSLTRARSVKETWANYLVSRGYTLLNEASNRYQGERAGIGGGGSSVGRKAAKGIIQLLNFNMKTGRLPSLEE